MESKICTKCKIEKELCEFNKNSQRKDGYSLYCKNCRKIDTKKYRELNREKLLISSSNFRKENPLKVKESKKQYYINNIDKIKEKNRQYNLNNRDKRLLHYEKNKDKTIKKSLEWRKNNIIKKREWEKEYLRKKYKDDVLYKLSKNVRTRIREFIKLNKMSKNNTTFNFVGCTVEELKLHIENQFVIGMEWNNHGVHGWHIDHIIPLSSAKTEEDLYKLCHYTNLQPLWAKDNMTKGNKILKPLTNNAF